MMLMPCMRAWFIGRMVAGRRKTRNRCGCKRDTVHRANLADAEALQCCRRAGKHRHSRLQKQCDGEEACSQPASSSVALHAAIVDVCKSAGVTKIRRRSARSAAGAYFPGIAIRPLAMNDSNIGAFSIGRFGLA